MLALLRRLDPGEFRLAVAAPRALLDAFGADLDGVRVETEAVAAESVAQWREIGRLSRVIARFRPDIVNSHLFRSTAIAAPLARWHGVRAVETYHGREGWRQGLAPLRFLPDRLIGRLLDRVTVVPNGRDLSIFTPGSARESVRKELGLDRAVPLVGVVGRLEPQKGHVYLLDAWQAVTRALPDARLLLVGDGALRGALAEQARARAVADSVIFAGFRADDPRLLDAIDVLCLPSLYEGLPLTAIEASAMARPVVATAVDGTPEVVRDGHTGRLVPAADAPALARALLDLLRDPEGARRLGRAGRDWALARFDLDRQVEATARVYRSVVR